MAFVRYEGVAVRVGHVYMPILQKYGPKYDDIYGLTLHGWEQDRWLLTGLEWYEWERVAKDIQARVTDQVIADAVAAEPRPYQELDGARLTADLTGRRDRLVEGARKFYDHLADEVDIQATDASETVTATRDGDDLVIEVARREDGTRVPYFRRRFHDDETDDIRLYLRKGTDRVVVQGGRPPMTLRVDSGGRRRARCPRRPGDEAVRPERQVHAARRQSGMCRRAAVRAAAVDRADLPRRGAHSSARLGLRLVSAADLRVRVGRRRLSGRRRAREDVRLPEEPVEHPPRRHRRVGVRSEQAARLVQRVVPPPELRPRRQGRGALLRHRGGRLLRLRQRHQRRRRRASSSARETRRRFSPSSSKARSGPRT